MDRGNRLVVIGRDAEARDLSDRELEASWDILVRTGGSSGSQAEDEENRGKWFSSCWVLSS